MKWESVADYWKNRGVSRRPAHALAQGGISSVGDLRGCSPAELLRLPNFGYKSLRELNDIFNLGFDIPPLVVPSKPIQQPIQETLSDDLLHGVDAIAEFIGENKYRTYRLCAAKLIPVGKQGNLYVASKKALRDHYERLTSGVGQSLDPLTKADITPIRRANVG